MNVNYTLEMPTGSLTGSVSYSWRSEQFGSIFNRPWYRSPSYDQWDLRATWASMDKKYSVIGFIRNVGNTVGYEGGPSASRVDGFVPAHALGGVGTDSVPVLEGITSSYSITPPRTYGIELQYRFF